jgi:hypothetical protein
MASGLLLLKVFCGRMSKNDELFHTLQGCQPSIRDSIHGCLASYIATKVVDRKRNCNGSLCSILLVWGFFCTKNKSARDLISRALKVVFRANGGFLSADPVLFWS